MPDESAADGGESLRERVSALEQTVSDQQETIQRLMPSRRQTVAGLGLLGAGVGAGRLSSGTARAEAAGQVGTESDPVDVEAWDLNVQNGATIDGDPAGGFGTTTSISPSFDTWTEADPDRPAVIEFEARAVTDGSSNGEIRVDVDESGGTTADYGFSAAYADDGLGSGGRNRTTVVVYVPAGAQYQIRNTSDPTGDNSTLSERQLTL